MARPTTDYRDLWRFLAFVAAALVGGVGWYLHAQWGLRFAPYYLWFWAICGIVAVFTTYRVLKFLLFTLFFPNLITLLGVGVLLALLEWPREAHYVLEGTVEKVQLDAESAAEVGVDLRGFESLNAIGPGLRLELPDLVLTKLEAFGGQFVPPLDTKPLMDRIVQLQVTAADNLVTGRAPACEFIVDDALGMRAQFQTTKLTSDGTHPAFGVAWRPGRGPRERSVLEWDRRTLTRLDHFDLRIDRVLEKTPRFRLVLRHCKVSVLWAAQSVTSQAEAINVEGMLESTKHLVLRMAGPSSDASLLAAYCKPGPQMHVPAAGAQTGESAAPGTLTFQARELTTLTLPAISRGKIQVRGEKRLDLAQEFFGRPTVLVKANHPPAIQGHLQMHDCPLGADGIQVHSTGRAASIRVDGEEQISDQLSLFSQSSVWLAILAFLAWSVDKTLSSYGAKKAD